MNPTKVAARQKAMGASRATIRRKVGAIGGPGPRKRMLGGPGVKPDGTLRSPKATKRVEARRARHKK